MPRALTRDELQSQTRGIVLAAAERLFLQRGYHATSVAQIAEAAGRTQGSIYSNFAGKEALCLQVLRTHYEQALGEAGAALLLAEGMDAKTSVLEAQWRTLTEQTDWIGLAAEYLMSVRHIPEHAERIQETINGLREGMKAIVVSQLEEQGIVSDATILDDAATAVIATGVGFAISHTLGTVEIDQSTRMMLDEIHVWRKRIGEVT